MSLHKLVKLAAASFVGTMLVCAIIFYVGVDAIRIGGTRDQVISDAQGVVADVAPPPLYVIEAYKEVLADAAVPGSHAEHVANLRQLHEDFTQSEKRWSKSPFLTDDVKAELMGPSHRFANQFWILVEHGFLPASARGDVGTAQSALKRIDKVFVSHKTAVGKMIADFQRFAASQTREAESFTVEIGWLLALLGIGLIAGAVITAVLLMRRVVMPIGELSDVTASLAEGCEVTVPSTGRTDELGKLAQAVDFFRNSAAERRASDQRDAAQKLAMVEALAATLNRMASGDLRTLLENDFDAEFGAISDNLNQAISALRNMVQAVVESATAIQNGAEGISDAASDLSTRTQSNAAAIEETTAALAGVDQRVCSSRDAARNTAQSAERAKHAVELGLTKARMAAVTMEEVKAAAASVDEVMEALDKIAFQTRVLAMNAAIEAGAAGTAGKGFAVVAGLVSQLASRAETEAQTARQQLTATTTRIADAVKSVNEVEREFAGIVADVTTVTTLVEQLSQDAHAQAGAVAEISAAMRQMDISTQQNAAMVEETSAAADALLIEAKGLVDQAQTFKWNRRERSIPVKVDRRADRKRTGKQEGLRLLDEILIAK